MRTPSCVSVCSNNNYQNTVLNANSVLLHFLIFVQTDGALALALPPVKLPRRVARNNIEQKLLVKKLPTICFVRYNLHDDSGLAGRVA